jgi:hypothetical protein
MERTTLANCKIFSKYFVEQASQRLRQAADRLESPTALQLRLFQTMGEIAVNQNSTIILPVPIDLLRPYLSASPNSYEASAQKSEAKRKREQREAQRLYEQTIGDVSREVSSEEVRAEMPDGEASPQASRGHPALRIDRCGRDVSDLQVGITTLTSLRAQYGATWGE